MHEKATGPGRDCPDLSPFLTSQSVNASPLCDEGYEAVNGGFFQIVADLNESLCTNQCSVFGSVVGSGNYLCGTRVIGTTCSANSDCASGTACSTSQPAG